jgi:phosphatidylinositol-3,4,5-trisphosphate 3-phosphatase/dual-specificity protein phosphatase PTEN
MTSYVRRKVSRNKRRFKKDGFDLDLTYIFQKRIIAMGFPSDKIERFYRNPINEVQRFFETYHKDHYFLYNLCQERDFDHSKFQGRVKNFPFYDHNAPPLKLIAECCLDIQSWLNEDPKNMVGINCKAGKGRTGLIICCYLLHSQECKDTDEALRFYGRRRTRDGRGVTIASQQRYIRYYERILKELGGKIPDPIPLTLTLINIEYYPKKQFPSLDPYITIEMNDIVTFTSETGNIGRFSTDNHQASINVMGKVEGDIKIQLHAGKKVSLCHFWFNSGFIIDNKLELTKPEIDVANKDKKCNIFKDGFKMTLYFKEYDPTDIKEVVALGKKKTKYLKKKKLREPMGLEDDKKEKKDKKKKLLIKKEKIEETKIL